MNTKQTSKNIFMYIKSWIGIEKSTRVITFNQETGLKADTDMNTGLRKNTNDDLE